MRSASGGRKVTWNGCSTWTVRVALLTLPDASVAMQLTRLAPKLFPGTDSQSTTACVQASLTEGGAKATGAALQLPTTMRSASETGSNAGGVVSTTVMLLAQELTFPDWSWAEYAITVVPSGYEPAAGPVSVVGLHVSLAVAAPGVIWAEAFPVLVLPDSSVAE